MLSQSVHRFAEAHLFDDGDDLGAPLFPPLLPLRCRIGQRRTSASAVLHLLPLHGYRRVRSSLLGRVLHHCGLFIGFLAIAYAVTILLRFLWRALILWL